MLFQISTDRLGQSLVLQRGDDPTGQILHQIGGSKISWSQALADAAAYYENHKDYLANLLLHTTGYDSFVRYMTEINHDSLRDKILLSSGEEELEEITEMYLRAYCLGMVSLTCEWILGK